MKIQLNDYVKYILLVFLIFVPLLINAQGVELHPGYIEGTINYGEYTEDIRSISLYAYSNDGYNASLTLSNGETDYRLTVNTPEDGTNRVYNLNITFRLNNGVSFGLETATLNVSENQTVVHNYESIPPAATLALRVNENDGRHRHSTFLLYNKNSEFDFRLHTYISANELVEIKIPSGIAIQKTWAYAASSEEPELRVELDLADFEAEPGETVSFSWDVVFPEPVINGVISGSINYSPFPFGELSQHHIYRDNHIYLYNDGNFILENESPGQGRMNVYSSFYNNNIRSGLSWPSKYYTDESYNNVTINPGETKIIDIQAEPSILIGNVKLSGTASSEDTSSFDIGFSGVSETLTENGYSYSDIDPVTGKYYLYLMEGEWSLSRLRLDYNNYSNNINDYIYSRCQIYYYTKQEMVNISSGDIIEGYDIELPTGTVIIKFSSSDNSLVRYPRINGGMMTRDNSGDVVLRADISAYGINQDLIENQVKFISVPGEYTLRTSAYVNGTSVTFSPQEVVVVEGAEIVLEINGPKINIENPISELYINEDSLIINGLATDDAGIASITVNGDQISYVSTNNPDDPNEVSFSASYDLSDGPNKLEIIATDTAGKIYSDTRFVYRDVSAPVLSYTKSCDNITTDDSVTLQGTATDDNIITKITVNGLSVDFISTNNPDDPNEVSFTSTYNLTDGDNSFNIDVSDNCKRTSSENFTVIKVELDIIPPEFGVIEDVVLLQESLEGTVYQLPAPPVSDNTDPSPVVTNDAPEIYQLGETVVTWTAADAFGNTSTAIQTVIVERNDSLYGNPDLIPITGLDYYFTRSMTVKIYWDEIADPNKMGYIYYHNGERENLSFYNKPGHKVNLVEGNNEIYVVSHDRDGKESMIGEKLNIYIKPSFSESYPKKILKEIDGNKYIVGYKFYGVSENITNIAASYTLLDDKSAPGEWTSINTIVDENGSYYFYFDVTDNMYGKSLAVRLHGINNHTGLTEETGIAVYVYEVYNK